MKKEDPLPESKPDDERSRYNLFRYFELLDSREITKELKNSKLGIK